MKAKRRRKARGRKTVMHRGKPDWSGITLESDRSIKGNGAHMHDGYRYCNVAERRTAWLLDSMGIAFTPDVRIETSRADRFGKTSIYVPDVVFDGDEWLWAGADGTFTVIHGLENKKKLPSHQPGTYGLPLDQRLDRKQKILFERRGILIVVVGDHEIREWLHRFGRLPIYPLDFDAGDLP
ncbi:hypothetical protein ACFL26_01665 [Patescibacteria group bacterium]